jgi:nucleoside-diphosphate-sugar epimerase
MSQPILVTGGSGTLGRHVVARLLAAGHQVRLRSRHPRPPGIPPAAEWAVGELRSGKGLTDQLGHRTPAAAEVTSAAGGGTA